MMRKLLVPLVFLAVAACSSEPAQQESAGEFADRIGGQQSPDAIDPSQPTMDMPNTAAVAPPPGADVTKLEQLRDIAGVNLGPREGGCTFMEGNREMLIAAGLQEPTLPGKAVIRVGGGLTLLDSAPGGLNAIKQGTTFTGEGVTVKVAPAAGDGQSRPANISVTDANGKTANYSGNWICA